MEPDVHKIIHLDAPTLVVCCIIVIGLGISLVLVWCFCLQPQRPRTHQAVRVTLRQSPSEDRNLMHRRHHLRYPNAPNYTEIHRYYSMMEEESRNLPPSYESTL